MSIVIRGNGIDMGGNPVSNVSIDNDKEALALSIQECCRIVMATSIEEL